MSPELGTEVVDSGDIVKLNVPYSIVNVDEVTTEVSFYQGLRVEMVDSKGELGSVMLWKRQKVGKGSKLGAFIDLLGSNTDKWKGQLILFLGWEKNNRKILHTKLPSNLAQAVVESGGELSPIDELKKPRKSTKGG